MKTRIQDSQVFAPYPQGDTVTGEVKAEVTFFWSDIDEWKPPREAREFMQDAKSPEITDLKNNDII